MKEIRLSSDLVSGAVFLGFGIALLVIGWDYPVGSLMRVGPGLFPKTVGAALVIVGLSELARGFLREGGQLERWQLKPLLLVTGTFFLFALLVETTGLVLTSLAVMLVAALAGPDAFRPRQLLVIAIAPAVAALLFIYTLKVPLRVWPDIW